MFAWFLDDTTICPTITQFNYRPLFMRGRSVIPATLSGLTSCASTF